MDYYSYYKYEYHALLRSFDWSLSDGAGSCQRNSRPDLACHISGSEVWTRTHNWMWVNTTMPLPETQQKIQQVLLVQLGGQTGVFGILTP